MNRRTILGLISFVALLAAPAAASGGQARTIPTTVETVAGRGSSTELVLLVKLRSPNPRCLVGREVRMILVFPSGNRIVDRGVSGQNGYAGVGAPTTGATSGRVTVPRSNIGTRRHPKFCGPTFVGLA